MVKVHLLDPKNRITYFEESSRQIGISVSMIEKDYWVVWILGRLFSLNELKNYLTFKGGTSLSKIYQIIKRFSEDIDLSIERTFFGFHNEQLENINISRKQKNISLENLSHQCAQYISGTLMKVLSEDITKELNLSDTWKLFIDESDPARQTLIFEYPAVAPDKNDYIRPSVKIELGARSEHWPVSQHLIHSYAKETLKDKIEESEMTIRVLNIERTFWEKATILHQYSHLPANKSLPLRLSRHYYDFYFLLKSIKDEAIKNQHLLEKVAHHKDTYFPSAWANYAQAKKGTLKLTPPEHISKILEKDYGLMKEMFFEDPPIWNEIMDLIRRFEIEFNQ